jgi:hypothetical protein
MDTEICVSSSLYEKYVDFAEARSQMNSYLRKILIVGIIFVTFSCFDLSCQLINMASATNYQPFIV